MSWIALRPEVTCAEVFCGTKATAPHFQPFSLHWYSIISTTNTSGTASMECHTNTSAGTILLQRRYCSPKRSWDVEQWMWNSGTLPWHHTLACCAIKALERSFAGDTWEQSPIYFTLGMIVPAQKDIQAALLNKAAVLSRALCLLNAQSVSQGSELRLDKYNMNLGNIRFRMTTFANSET